MRKKGWIVSGILLAGILLVLILGIERGRAPGFVLFVGRFHPTVVHFPIALLLLAVAIELLGPRVAWAAHVRPAVPFLLALGAVSAVASVVLGYLLSLGGGYEEAALSLHLWMGLATAVLAIAMALASAWSTRRGRMFKGMMIGLAALVVVAGHLGAGLARGSGYLTYYLPATVKAFIGIEGGAVDGLIANVDSALVYHDLVQPILDRRCVECHGLGKSKGDLRLDTREGIAKGGRDGLAFVAGNPSQSEIVRRITLPSFDEDAMPPDGGPPLDVGETEVIRWWIANGASFDVRVAEIAEPPTAVSTYLARVAQPRTPERSGILALDVQEPDSQAVATLTTDGLLVTRMMPEAPFLEVSATNVRARFTDAELPALRPVAPQIAVLDLGHTQITDDAGALLAKLPHLTHLHLEGTAVGDAALAHLASLEYLEYLNLYGTGVTDHGLGHLQALPALRAVYLWQTDVTEEAADALRQALPGSTINLGSNLATVDPDSTEGAP